MAGDLAQRAKFALWNLARLHPGPGALVRWAGRIALGDVEAARRARYAAAVPRLWREHQDGRRNNYKKLWALIVLQSWRQRTLAA